MDKSTQMKEMDLLSTKPRQLYAPNADSGLQAGIDEAISNGTPARSQDTVSDSSKYHCQMCNLTFPDKFGMQHHSSKLHTLSTISDEAGYDIHAGKYACKICPGVAFNFGNELNKHISTNHKTYEGYHNCKICDKTFSELRYLRIHLRRHSGVRNHLCAVCDCSFFEPNKLKLHMETHKETAKKRLPYKCPICSYQFHNRSGFQDHLNTHTGKRPYLCTLCPSTFTHRMGLQHHQVVHSDERQYTCGVCDKGFKFKTKLQEHIVSHTNNGRFQCQDCNRAYGAATSLKRHIRSGTCKKGKVSNVFICGACNFRFRTRPLFESHKCKALVIGTTGVEMDDFICLCSACGTMFKQLDKADFHVCDSSPQTDVTVDDSINVGKDVSPDLSIPTSAGTYTMNMDMKGNTVIEGTEPVMLDNVVLCVTEYESEQHLTVTSTLKAEVIDGPKQYVGTDTTTSGDTS